MLNKATKQASISNKVDKGVDAPLNFLIMIGLYPHIKSSFNEQLQAISLLFFCFLGVGLDFKKMI